MALEKASFVEKVDIWSVGKHRLVCGDAIDGHTFAPSALRGCKLRYRMQILT